MKQHIWKKIIALTLAFSLTAGQAALASDALGWDLHSGEETLSAGVTMTRGWFWSDTYKDLRTELYLTYIPNGDVTPTVAYGDTLYSQQPLSDMAKAMEEQGKRVVGGVNGDFYVVSSGQPLGMVVTDGVLRSSSSYVYAVGFRSDGSAFIGQPDLKLTARWGETSLNLTGGLNKTRKTTAEGGGPVLLTGDIGTKTGNTQPGVDVILRPLPTIAPDYGWTGTSSESDGEALPGSEELRINTRTVCQVVELRETTGKEGTIPEGCYVISVNGAEDASLLEKVRALEPGDRVEISVTAADPVWDSAVTAIGGLYRLLEGGQICAAPSGSENAWKQQTARTAIGIKADGTVLFYTLDGRIPGTSVGISLTQAAQRLMELGCVDALCLDGGGSTTLGVTRPEEDGFAVANTPRDGKERKITNAIFLTTTLTATGEPAYLQLEPGDALVLAGTALPLTAWQVDTGYRRMDPADHPVYTVEGDGSVEDGVFTAGSGEPTTKVGSAQALVTAQDGELTGQARITVIRDPDQVSLSNSDTGLPVTTLALQPGETVSLQASAKWRNLELLSQNDCYTWTCDPAVGAVTPDGVFTAGEATASGSLTLTAGTASLTIPVKVTGHILRLEGFEGEDSPFQSSDAVTAVLSDDLSHVRAGRRSLKLDYDLTAGAAGTSAALSLPAGERYVGAWVYGDGSGNALEAQFSIPAPEIPPEELDPTGTDLPQTEPSTISVPVCALDFTGWRHLLLPIPEGADTLTGLTFPVGEEEPAVPAGTVWVDHLTVSNEAAEDTVAPTVAVESRAGLLVAQAADDLDDALESAAVTATYDGKPLEGTFDPVTGTFTAVLPADEEGKDHRITVTARDQSGNLGSASLTVAGELPNPFADMTDHWAASFVNYLYQQKISSGVSSEGEPIYDPSGTLTRAQFFTMVCLWLGMDVSQYEQVELPFADLGEIPSWALPYLRAAYAEGILAGSRDGEALYAYPLRGITRSEVMTILGLTQEKGGTVDDLASFTDAAAVPDWARSYVESLVGRGVINGYEDGTLRPTAPMTRAEAAVVLYTMR